MLPNRDFVDGDAAEIRRLFETEYRRLFGRALDGLDIEIMNWSVQVRSELLQSARVDAVKAVTPRHSDESRRIFDAREQRFVDAAIYRRDDLQSGDRVDGPAVIIETETSTVVTSRYQAVRQPDGCLLLTQKGKN
jgi:N-methylhydantoinase A